jgi:hypothetical protein
MQRQWPTTKTYVPEFDSDKFKELMLYIADQCQGDPYFGATKLNKILFFSDFFAYALYGQPITGAMYQRLEKGPAPKQLLPSQKELIGEKRAEVIERMRFNRKQKRLIAKVAPRLSRFTPDEIALVDHIMEWLAGKTALETSNVSHDTCLGWQLAGDKQEIPYEAVFLSSTSITPVDIRVGQEVAGRHGFLVSTKS